MSILPRSWNRTPLRLLLAACWASMACSPPEVVKVSHPDWPVGFELEEGQAPRFSRVVLVTLDTLRADHVSAYGYERPTTPFLDSLAERGVLFERAVASVSQTAPSHASMLTGLPPSAHGVLENGLTLPAEAVDAASLFRAAGFRTAAFLNVKFLSGVAQNFEKTEVRLLEGGPVVDAAIEWLREASPERFFLWVHLYDPHHWKRWERAPHAELAVIREATRKSPTEWYRYLEDLHALRPQVPGHPFDLGWTVEIKGGGRLVTESPDDYLRLIDAYDAYTLYADHQLERLYRAVESMDQGGSSLWLITSDHGEGLGSHQVAGHGGRIYQEQLLVPLVIHASDGSLGPRRVAQVVQHTDFLPTFASIVGARLTGATASRFAASLWPLIDGRSGWRPRRAFSQRRPMKPSEPDRDAVFSLQDLRFKYILHEPGDDEFFDLEVDPHELTNLASAPGRERDSLREELRERLRTLAREKRRSTGDVPREWVEELRDLGYVGGSD